MKTLTQYELSQFLSLILRHKPETIHLDMDEYGYASIEQIIINSKDIGYSISKKEIENTVSDSDKQRFKIVKGRIKATKGHSIDVKKEEKGSRPPDILYHGTNFKNKESILQEGLLRMNQSFVHLYKDFYKSFMTGNRTKEGTLVFEIDAKRMYDDGFEFYLSDDVWQTKSVSSDYLKIKDLNEIESLQKIIITKTTYYTKIINEQFKLDPKFNSQPSIYVNDCYICGSKRSWYSFNTRKVICEELTYDKRRAHVLSGKTLDFEQFQDEQEIRVKSVFELSIKRGHKLQIEKDTKYQGIGIRFNCPVCDEYDFISNSGCQLLNCRKCDTPLLKMERPTEICQEIIK